MVEQYLNYLVNTDSDIRNLVTKQHKHEPRFWNGQAATNVVLDDNIILLMYLPSIKRKSSSGERHMRLILCKSRIVCLSRASTDLWDLGPGSNSGYWIVDCNIPGR